MAASKNVTSSINIIKEDQFRKQLKKGICGGFLFFGEEDYLKSFALRSVRDALCPDPTFAVFNDISIAPLEYSPSVLVNSLMAPPMMTEQKLVSLSGLAISEMRPSEFDDLCDAVSTIKEYDYNVLIISVPSGLIDEGTLPRRPSSAICELAKYLTPVHFEAISESRLVGWVGKHFSHNGVNASPEVCSALIERCGRSMFTLAGETDKISYYLRSKGRDTVTQEDVREISCAVIDSDAYALANSVLDGKYAEAMDALNVMRFKRVEPVIILSEVSRVLCDLVSVKALQDQGLPLPQIASVLKMNEYKARLYASSAAQRSAERLRRALLLCADADSALKRSPLGYAAIERLICSL